MGLDRSNQMGVTVGGSQSVYVRRVEMLIQGNEHSAFIGIVWNARIQSI